MALLPVRFTPSIEQVQDGEAATIAELEQAFAEIQHTTALDYGHAVRAVHAKSHGVLKGTLRVEADLPRELAQGLFAQGGDHPVFLRLSTNAGDILHDSIALPRGLAMKVCDVAGERLPDAEGTTQDFVMVNAPAFAAPDAASFAKNLKLLAKTTDRVEGLKKAAATLAHGVNAARQAVGMDPAPSLALMGGMPNVEPLGETYFSATPYRYGDYVAKFSLRPVAPWMQELTGKTIDVKGRENAIREEVQAELRRAGAQWEMRVQLLRDPERQPVEDATVEWPEEASPWQRVAMVDVPAQDSWSDETVQQVNEAMRFSPWTGLAAHQPLGNINRARKATYHHSAEFRARLNGCPMREPGGRHIQ